MRHRRHCPPNGYRKESKRCDLPSLEGGILAGVQPLPEEAQEDLPPGALVAGRFEIIRPLGRGGMATVYEARHTVTDRPVALKVANQTLVNNKVLSGRFLREARTASTIRHAHAIEVSDVFEAEEGRPVIVMELLHGRDLGDFLESAGKLSPREVAEIFVPVLSALSHAHAAGIVHRDVKPDNIFLAEVDGKVTPKVLDFGIAKVVGDAVDSSLKLTTTGTLLGTPYYMSPEQVSGSEDVDHRADLWSVGVCLYQALEGKLPFDGANFGQVFALILQSDPPKMQADVPPGLEELVFRCLAKRPDDRPADCGEVARVLSEYCDAPRGQFPAPTPALQSGTFEAAPGSPARRPVALFAAVLGAVLLAAASWFALRGSDPGPRAEELVGEASPGEVGAPAETLPDAPEVPEPPEQPGEGDDPASVRGDEEATGARPDRPRMTRMTRMTREPPTMGAATMQQDPEPAAMSGIINQL